jgi:hypothetical protein
MLAGPAPYLQTVGGWPYAWRRSERPRTKSMETPPVPTSLAALLQALPTIYPSGKGKVYIWEPAPGIVVSRVTGVLTAEGAQVLETVGRRSIGRHGSLTAFHDWEDMTDYDPAARTQLTKFGLDSRKSFDTVHIMVRSTIVRLGVQAANLVVRTMHMHDSRNTFEAALRKAIMDKR